MLNLLLEGTSNTSNIVMLVILGVLVVLMLVLPSITQKKKVSEYKAMQDSLKTGDKVQTIGGIVGRINKITEKDGVKTVLIETGDKSNKMVIEFDLNAIAGVVVGVKPKTEETTEPVASIETSEVKAEETEVAPIDVDFDKEMKEKAQQKATNKNNKKSKK